MYHSHFNSIHSTQIYLRDNLLELKTHDNDILISASEQTLGIGRKGNQWDSYKNSIAMSFTIKPNPVPTLTPIEIGVLTCIFLKNEYNISIYLKWPNDLLNSEGKKCGGIIAQYIDSETVIVGLGLNLGAIFDVQAPMHYKHGLGNVSDSLILSPDDQKNIPAKIFQHMLSHRIDLASEMQSQFYKHCAHVGRLVSIEDDGFNYEGKFLGIGKNGEAMVEIEGNARSFLSSSLTIIN